MLVKELSGASNRADVSIYLGKDHIYKVGGQELKKSSWMYDRLLKHEPRSYSLFTKDDSPSPTIDLERVEGIIAFFRLPTGANKLERVSRQRSLSLLPATPLVKLERTEDHDNDIKMEGTEKVPTALALRFRETTSSTTP